MRTVYVLLCLLFFTGCKSTEPDYTVVASTSMIAAIVEQIGDERVEVVTIVPAGMCPGQFDLNPGDLRAAANAQLVLMHGWEHWMDELVLSVCAKDSIVKEIPVEGNWMIPSVHVEAVDSIVEALSSVEPGGGEYFRAHAAEYKRRVAEREWRSKSEAELFSGIPVVTNQHQAEFLEWLGFRVVSTFASHWDTGPQEVVEIVSTARRENTLLVVDNLQDNTRMGQIIAEAADRDHVVLTNFPVNESYIDAVDSNIRRLTEAIQLSRIKE